MTHIRIVKETFENKDRFQTWQESLQRSSLNGGGTPWPDVYQADERAAFYAWLVQKLKGLDIRVTSPSTLLWKGSISSRRGYEESGNQGSWMSATRASSHGTQLNNTTHTLSLEPTHPNSLTTRSTISVNSEACTSARVHGLDRLPEALREGWTVTQKAKWILVNEMIEVTFRISQAHVEDLGPITIIASAASVSGVIHTPSKEGERPSGILTFGESLYEDIPYIRSRLETQLKTCTGSLCRRSIPGQRIRKYPLSDELKDILNYYLVGQVTALAGKPCPYVVF